MARTKSPKIKKTNTKFRNRRLSFLYAGYTLLLVALLLTIIWAMMAPRNTFSSLATPQEKEQAKEDISELFADRRVDHCPHPDLPETRDNIDGYVVDYRYLRINKYGNRAIITSCNNTDTLLSKASNGSWIETSVSLTMNNRVNPVWQKECLIEDITVADDIARPENSSIDAFNLEGCKELKTI